jgi:sugar/nucleoside kinase (ribokinase family)
VGLACLDVILLTVSFPLEDSDQRALDRYSNRGGNASNVATVLAELGDVDVEFLGTLAEDLESEAMVRDFKAHNIRIDRCPRLAPAYCIANCQCD